MSDFELAGLILAGVLVITGLGVISYLQYRIKQLR